jgi:crotonobetainyl-CoA:carnitine CoA-transferase CaiB-like acyl-CoA transferase
VSNREALSPLLVDIMRQGGRDAWIEKLDAAGVPCGPINDIGQAFAHPQALARGLRREMPHSLGVPVPITASPMRLSGSPVAYDLPPPMLGEHTRDVLRDVLGKTDAQVDALIQGGGAV